MILDDFHGDIVAADIANAHVPAAHAGIGGNVMPHAVMVRLDQIEMRLDRVEMRLDRIEMQLDRTEMRWDRTEMRLDRIDRNVNRVYRLSAIVSL